MLWRSPVGTCCWGCAPAARFGSGPADLERRPPFWPQWSAQDWGLMAYASVFGSALAYGLFFTFASRGDLTGFSSLTFLTPCSPWCAASYCWRRSSGPCSGSGRWWP
ncbi:EamA family transporter [Cyanobium sp. ATX-6F1]|uniref:EamA family transporter n=1 Tax=Cyanobium sp. ATX-6F1 TaxID=3137388 RepID=UPI0039BEAA9D